VKTLTIRRWLGIAWLIYFFSSAQLFGLLTYWSFHSTPEQFPFRFYIPLQIFTQVLLALVISWFVGKALLRPLAAMSQAARQIAGGDLNFSLPPSRVREVAEVAAAFSEMGKALRVALERQSELEQERRLFISAIAHDLRTPLFSLRGYLEGLEAGIATTPEKVAHYIAVCREKAGDLEKRISDLFAYARLEYLEQTPRYTNFDLNQLLSRLTESFKPQLEAKQIELRLEAPPEPALVRGDESLLTRMFENLLDNAICYTPRQGLIRLNWEKQPERIAFRLTDSGPGLSAQELPYLFDPLFRGKQAQQGQTGGAGLGLTIARRILLAHGGGLKAANRPEGGAEFSGFFSPGLRPRPGDALTQGSLF
jgi:signal transduction histidine kinase